MKDIKRGQRPKFDISPATEAVVYGLKTTKDPIAHAVASVLERIDVASQEIQWQSEKLLDTEFQTKTTNGRVTDIETELDKKRNFNRGITYFLGGLAALALSVVGVMSNKILYLMRLDDKHIESVSEQVIERVADEQDNKTRQN